MRTAASYPQVPGMVGEPWITRRAFYAQLLRTARRLRKSANAAGGAFPVGAFFVGVQTVLVARRLGWWRWADDLAQGRSPLDYCGQARRARRNELLARFEDQSAGDCRRGLCPPLPRSQILAAATAATPLAPGQRALKCASRKRRK